MRMLPLIAALLALFAAAPVRAETAIVEVTSPGGLTAWLVEEHDLPFVALELGFRGGTSLDLPGSRGAVTLMAALLEEGAGALDARGFAEARDGLAAQFGFSADADMVGVSARFLTENRDQATDLLRQAILEPRFDADAIARVRGQVLAGIEADAKDPGNLAGARFSALAWGDHPYGSPDQGTTESVAALTRDDLIEAHRGTMARDRLFIAAAGDITPGELGQLLDRLLGGLPEVGRQQPARAEWRAAGGVEVVDVASPQSVILFGQEGIARDDPDFMAAYLLNEILGGGRFDARLMTELRDRRGLTYGVSTALLPMDHGAMMIGQMATANATAAEAVGLIRAEWQRLAAGDVTEAELAAAKAYVKGSYPLLFDGNSAIAGLLVGMQMQGRGVDYAATRGALIDAVTLDDLRRVAARLLRPEALLFVVAGQPEGLPPAD